MNILIMGVGYVGVALLPYLLQKGHTLYLTTTNPKRIDLLKQYTQHILLLDENGVSSWIDQCDAMIVLVAPNNGNDYRHTYLNTARHISSALEGRKKPFYLLYTSSTSVCEGAQGEQISEKTPLSPSSENGRILLETEKEYLGIPLKPCVLRLGGIYGPDRELIHRAKLLSGKEMPGTGEEPTNHIHLDDIIRGILFCLERRLTGIYHLVNDEHRKKKELYEKLCASCGLPPPMWRPHIAGGRHRGIVSNQKIKEAGFRFSHPL